jgi:hypothetical protein
LSKYRIAASLAGLGLAAAAIIGCSPGAPTGVGQENVASHQISANYNAAQPIPEWKHSVYRQVLTQIEAIQVLGTQTTSFFFNQGEKDPQGSCPSEGMPIPNTAELSNPETYIADPNAGSTPGSITLPNMDPNGVYVPSSSTGTYVLCLGANGQPYANYWEGFVQTVSGAAHWDYGTHQLVVTGESKLPTCTTTANGAKKATTCTK